MARRMLTRTFLSVALPLAFVAVATLHCGGALDTTDLPECPSDGTCTSACKATVTDCTGAHTVSCTCDSSGYAECAEFGEPDCQVDCTSLLHGDSTCSVQGERCVSPTQSACLDATTLYCTCESGQFVCDVPTDKCGPPPTKCPPPDEVQPGAPCSTSLGTCDSSITVSDCEGNVIGNVACSCGSNGFFECESPPTPPCDVDGGSN